MEIRLTANRSPCLFSEFQHGFGSRDCALTPGSSNPTERERIVLGCLCSSSRTHPNATETPYLLTVADTSM